MHINLLFREKYFEYVGNWNYVNHWAGDIGIVENIE